MADKEAAVIYREAALTDRAGMRRMWRGLALHQAGADDRLSLASDFVQRWDADFEPWVRSPVHRLFVAQSGIDASQIIGFVHARHHESAPMFDGPPEVFVEALWVDEIARSAGVARALVDNAKEWAAQIGAKRVRYSVICHDESAVSFWARMGGDPLITYGTIDVTGDATGVAARKRTESGTIGFTAGLADTRS